MSKPHYPPRWKAVRTPYTDGLDEPLWSVVDTYRGQPLYADERGGLAFFSHTDAVRQAAALNRTDKASRR